MPRILAGRHKGRVVPCPSEGVRPTLGYVRQRIFDLLGPACFAAAPRVLDGFAGTGALGWEALSRGASFVTFIEKDPLEARAISATALKWQEQARVRVITGDFFAFSGPLEPVDLVFLDPPYRKDTSRRLVKILARASWVAPSTCIVLEMEKEARLSFPPDWELLKERVAGPSRCFLFRKSAEE
ncbi:MAG: RsmD family RNA methyltransferase [Holosporales bacterium]|nr:RsmD family RNA methyltransferase [Holosporales bacterium]